MIGKTVNDNVMGGRSKGGPSFKNGILTFSGATNTDGGGFSSIRTEPGEFNLSGKSGLLIRARGDGRTYKMELRTDIKMRDWSVPFRADFETVKGEWREFFIPLESFTPTLFGQRLPAAPKLDPSKVSSLGFMIYDKKDGEFSLEVDWVKAVSQDRSDSGRESGTIISKALADGRFGTLAAALTESGLIEVLQGEGPFTVFAPTDEAFAKLPKGTVEDLLKPENQEKLQAMLKYHVSPGAIGLAPALEAGAAKTVQGESVSIAFADGRVKANGATILSTDIECDNGVIHVIDAVLLPESEKGTSRQEQSGDRAKSGIDPVARIKDAIQRGVPIFNEGNPGRCAEIYKECLTGLAEDQSIDPKVRAMLKKLIDRAGKAQSAADRAWLYRSGLDYLYAAMTKTS